MTELKGTAEDICKACQTRLTPTMKCSRNCCIMAEVVAAYLYNAGYRKLTDHAINVLRQAKDMEDKVRKQTVKELLTLMLSDEYIPYFDENIIKELAGKYGVEIEE